MKVENHNRCVVHVLNILILLLQYRLHRSAAEKLNIWLNSPPRRKLISINLKISGVRVYAFRC